MHMSSGGTGFLVYLLRQPKHLLMLPEILHNVNGEQWLEYGDEVVRDWPQNAGDGNGDCSGEYVPEDQDCTPTLHGSSNGPHGHIKALLHNLTVDCEFGPLCVTDTRFGWENWELERSPSLLPCSLEEWSSQ